MADGVTVCADAHQRLVQEGRAQGRQEGPRPLQLFRLLQCLIMQLHQRLIRQLTAHHTQALPHV